jgi:hypothetical protein
MKSPAKPEEHTKQESETPVGSTKVVAPAQIEKLSAISVSLLRLIWASYSFCSDDKVRPDSIRLEVHQYLVGLRQER